MEALGPVGCFWRPAAYFVLLAVYALVRIMFRERPVQRAFVSLPRRSLTAALLLAESSDDDDD
jgi:hypothetical protein